MGSVTDDRRPNASLAEARSWDTVYLSPHPDDAVFSCGGRIFEECSEGRAVLIVTVAAGDLGGPVSPFARRLERKAGLADGASRERREEDRRAVAALGAELLQWGLVDAVYRNDPDTGRVLYPSRRRLFGPIHPRDREFEQQLVERLEALPDCRELRLPLGLGGHVDHALVRRTAEERSESPVGYWEDFPYVAHRSGSRGAPSGGEGGWSPETFPLSPQALEARCRAMAEYSSQMRLIFGDDRRMRARVHRYVDHVGGERYWRRVRATG